MNQSESQISTQSDAPVQIETSVQSDASVLVETFAPVEAPVPAEATVPIDAPVPAETPIPVDAPVPVEAHVQPKESSQIDICDGSYIKKASRSDDLNITCTYKKGQLDG